jgi:hypothetical protein
MIDSIMLQFYLLLGKVIHDRFDYATIFYVDYVSICGREFIIDRFDYATIYSS